MQLIFFHTRSKKDPNFFFRLKEIHSWWNCCGFWIHVTITVHLIIFIANQSTFRPSKTFSTFLSDAISASSKSIRRFSWWNSCSIFFAAAGTRAGTGTFGSLGFLGFLGFFGFLAIFAGTTGTAGAGTTTEDNFFTGFRRT